MSILIGGLFGLPRRRVTVMYAAWAFAVGVRPLCSGAMTELSHALAISFVLQAGASCSAR